MGFAVLCVGEHFTIDEVVFAEQGDLLLLGARTLEGLNLAVDTQRKKTRRRGTDSRGGGQSEDAYARASAVVHAPGDPEPHRRQTHPIGGPCRTARAGEHFARLKSLITCNIY